jgi:hypothetical protein
MKTQNQNIINPQLADSSRPLLRLRSPNHSKPSSSLLLVGIAIGWLLHSAFHHLTQIQTVIP